MSGSLSQLGFAKETTYGTAVAPAKWLEFIKEDIKGKYPRLQADGLQAALFDRNDRYAVTNKGASGSIDFEVLTKGHQDLIGFMNGAVVTSGPTETVVYTHTATPANLFSHNITVQVGRPTENDTVKPWTYEGGKVTGYSYANSTDKLLTASIEMDFELESQPASPAGAYILGTPSFPSGAEVLSWMGATITVGGTTYDVSDFSIKVDNSLNADRWFLHKGQSKREPVQDGKRKVEFSLTVPYIDSVLWQKVSAATASGSYAALVAKWEGPTLAGSTIYPNLTITCPLARFDEGQPNVDGPGMLDQTLTGMCFQDTGNPNAITVAYQTLDTTALI